MSEEPRRTKSTAEKVAIAFGCLLLVLIAAFIFVASRFSIADDTTDHRSTVERFRQATSQYAPGRMLYWLGRGPGVWRLTYPDPRGEQGGVSLEYDVREQGAAVGRLEVLTYWGMRPSTATGGGFGTDSEVIARVRTATNQDVELWFQGYSGHPAPSDALTKALVGAVRPVTDTDIQQYSTRD